MNFLFAALQAVAFGSKAPEPKPLPSKTDQLRFSQLAAQNRSALFRFLLSQGAAPDLAEDCMQEALVRAYRSLDTLRDWDAAKGWLFGIARNVFIDEARKRAVRSRPLNEEAQDSPELADEQMEKQERAAAIRKAIDKLGPPRGEIVELHYSRGLTMEEISRRLDIPVGTIKAHLHRARAALRKQLVALQEG